jgi:hypothetical protein
MVDKTSGQIAYAVMSFGGFLGIGESYHPLPWRVLKYDVRQGGYVVDLDRRRLETAPSYSANSLPNWSDPTYGQWSVMAWCSPRPKPCMIRANLTAADTFARDKTLRRKEGANCHRCSPGPRGAMKAGCGRFNWNVTS